MILWFENKDLKINFNSVPSIGIRYILPSMSNEERKLIKKYPFINRIPLEVRLEDKNKSKEYCFTIPKKYCFDGASVPRFFWRIIGSNTDNKFLVPAMIHDFMCENHDCVDNDRAFSTEVFNALLSVSGVGSFKRFWMKNSVDIFQKCFCHWKK